MNSRVLLILFNIFWAVSAVLSTLPQNTIERIVQAGYSAETHTVQTSQGYILTLHRITASPFAPNATDKPAVFLQHGILCSSDLWVLDQTTGLGFNLADNGFDVWLGNARGNTYSRSHVTRSPLFPNFWDFSWHEIAIDDVPTMVNYVRSVTNQSAIHYIGHSQGTTELFGLLTIDPDFGANFKTTHALAPVAYIKYAESPIVRYLSPILGRVNLRLLLGSGELLPNNDLISLLAGESCQNQVFQELCRFYVLFFGGFGSEETDDALVPHFLTAFPAGSSVEQLVHVLQIAQSDIFRQYDYGRLGNILRHGSLTPPIYNLANIQNLIYTYASLNDAVAHLTDVERLEAELPNVVTYRIDKPTFNHFDFFLGRTVKEDVNDLVIQRILDFENN